MALDEVDAFLAMDRTGRVTLYSGKVELGTGVSTALPQIVAEELDVPLKSIALIEGDTSLTPAQGKTWGSLTIQVGGMQIRQAAATARQALLQEAGKRLGVPARRSHRRAGYVERAMAASIYLWRPYRRQELFAEG